MKTKKGLAMNMIMIFLVILLIFGILLVFHQNLRDIYRSYISSSTCASSVKSHGFLADNNLQKNSPIKCPTEEIKITTKSEEKAKNQVAKLYYSLCNEFRGGDVQLFTDEDKVYCVIRHLITFDDKNMEIKGLADYMDSTAPRGKTESYFELCKGFKTEDVEDHFEKVDRARLLEATLHGDKTYATIFLYGKSYSTIASIYQSIIGDSIPFVRFFDPERVSFFLLREYNEANIKKLGCEYLPAQQR